MRIVAGRFGGRRIVAPAGPTTRPTADRVREALFSMLGPLEGIDVLDLFAGSGALGLEALSRGARSADFVDSDRRAAAAVRRNLAALGVEAAVHERDALTFAAGAGRSGRSWQLVFLDPPYSSAGRMASPLSAALVPILQHDALIVCESDKRAPLELSLPLVRERTYGDTRIAIHRAG